MPTKQRQAGVALKTEHLDRSVRLVRKLVPAPQEFLRLVWMLI